MTGGLLDDISRDITILDLLADEFEQLAKQVFEPDFEVGSYFQAGNHATVWGGVSLDDDYWVCLVSRLPCEDWIARSRFDPNYTIARMEVRERGICMFDEVIRKSVTHAIESPKLLEHALDHLYYDVTHKLEQTQLRFEFMIQKAELPGSLVDWDTNDLDGRLAVLKRKQQTLKSRYELVRARLNGLVGLATKEREPGARVVCP